MGCQIVFGESTIGNISLYYKKSSNECLRLYLSYGTSSTSVSVYDIDEHNHTVDRPAWRNETVYFPSAGKDSIISLLIGIYFL